MSMPDRELIRQAKIEAVETELMSTYPPVVDGKRRLQTRVGKRGLTKFLYVGSLPATKRAEGSGPQSSDASS